MTIAKTEVALLARPIGWCFGRLRQMPVYEALMRLPALARAALLARGATAALQCGEVAGQHQQIKGNREDHWPTPARQRCRQAHEHCGGQLWQPPQTAQMDLQNCRQRISFTVAGKGQGDIRRDNIGELQRREQDQQNPIHRLPHRLSPAARRCVKYCIKRNAVNLRGTFEAGGCHLPLRCGTRSVDAKTGFEKEPLKIVQFATSKPVTATGGRNGIPDDNAGRVICMGGETRPIWGPHRFVI